ncbi:MAG: PEP-CTERM sorting domain-containing protein [Fimbriimonadaceae bacterium]|nr:PEP-CTERM sorting domain-containing protein [Fimbriimonadaceae bacterium]
MLCARAWIGPTLILAASAANAQISLGKLDTFQDGTVMGWSGGAAPTNIADGGPLGAGDRYLQITSDGGSGAGGKLATYNFNWSGDYTAAQVTGVEVWIQNLSATETLEMRAVILSGATRWTSNSPLVLAPGSGWTQHTFSLLESDITRVLGSTSYTATMASVSRLMFRHDSGAPDAEGTAIAAQGGLDNIRAVPEPASMLALGAGVSALVLRRRRAR